MLLQYNFLTMCMRVINDSLYNDWAAVPYDYTRLVTLVNGFSLFGQFLHAAIFDVQPENNGACIFCR